MKKSMAATLAFVALLATGATAAQKEAKYTGVVTANQIASGFSVGFWEKKLNCHGEQDCAQRLVQAGGKYVLVTSKGVFQLNDQAKAAQFVARQVTVTGVASKGSIAVADIQTPSPVVNAGAE
jgi:acyl CoA:acetate/3-ketoacid CoA transferase beta subunit